MNYIFFINNLPSDLIPLINSYVDPETDYFLTILKERVRVFSRDGLYRISKEEVRENHSYFSKYEGLEKEEKEDTLNLNENIKEIITVKNIIKELYKPMIKRTTWLYAIKQRIEPKTKGSIIILALLLLGVKYKFTRGSQMLIEFYCNI